MNIITEAKEYLKWHESKRRTDLTNLPLDLISRLVDMLEWKPIDSAPKDGSVIYGIDTENGNQGCVKYNEGGNWESVNHYGGDMGIGFFPDKWLPLPPVGDK